MNWTNKDIEFLKANRGKLKNREIAAHLNRTTQSVIEKAIKLGLAKKRKARTWTKAEEQFLIDNRDKFTLKKIAAKLKRSPAAVQAKQFKLNILIKPSPREWTKDEIEFLINNYKKMEYKEIGKIINRHVGTIRLKLYRLGLRLPEEIKISRRNGCLKKGHGWNKGLKGIHFSPATEFKKGEIHREEFDGCIKIRRKYKDRNVQYKFIRVSRGKWEPLHRYNYKKYIGPIAKGYMIRFKDGDTLNCKPENLYKIKRSENMRMSAVLNNRNFINSDKWVAWTMSGRSKEVRDEILNNHPELIDLQREKIKLQRKMKKAV